MSGFSGKQIRSLQRKLDRRHVRTREIDGQSIDYIEGWFAISEANAIFGFDGWDREMVHFERLYERNRNDRTHCGYMARVRLRVRAGENVVIREGTGWGNASASVPSDAQERALKAAETDATKRALATFGNRFGLALYDKGQNGLTAKKTSVLSNDFCLYEPRGSIFADRLSAEAFCSGLRQLIENISEPSEVESLLRLNEGTITRLRVDAPELKTAKGAHYADVLERLAHERMVRLPEPV